MSAFFCQLKEPIPAIIKFNFQSLASFNVHTVAFTSKNVTTILDSFWINCLPDSKTCGTGNSSPRLLQHEQFRHMIGDKLQSLSWSMCPGFSCCWVSTDCCNICFFFWVMEQKYKKYVLSDKQEDDKKFQIQLLK